jgi:hypothetical protein
MSELSKLESADEAARWAHRVLREKDGLTKVDAERVESAFRSKLATFASETGDEPHDQEQDTRRRKRATRRSQAINKTVLTLPLPRRIRDREHVKSVAKQPCLVCGRRPADAHHLRFAQPPALGRKVSDEFTVPLCRGHHREVHRCTDEASWWNKTGVDPSAVARALWVNTHPFPILSD